jgi:LPS-assembly lipoprotein
MKKRIGHWFALLLALSFLSACGFRLRGYVEMPPWLDHVAIVVQDANRDLEVRLKNQLQAYGRHIVTDPTQADYMLILEKDNLQQKINSVAASTTPRQYQLIYTVRYSLIKRDGTPVVTSRLVAVTRQLTVNNDRILGSDSEELIIISAMRQEAVMQIINRMGR